MISPKNGAIKSMKQNNKTLIVFVAGLLIGALALYLYSNYTIQKKDNSSVNYTTSQNQNTDVVKKVDYNTTTSIDQLTNENVVIKYVKEHQQLPDYYITKAEAKRHGWVASKGNLCDVLPGKAIGGDYFSNREGSLPKGEKYYEADVNYNCGRRNADRIVYTKNGDVYLTKNHYKSFQKQ